MLLIHQSHVFKLRVERKFEMCYPWSTRNATSVLQRRKPGKIEKRKAFFAPLPPPKKKKMKQKKNEKKNKQTKENKDNINNNNQGL